MLSQNYFVQTCRISLAFWEYDHYISLSIDTQGTDTGIEDKPCIGVRRSARVIADGDNRASQKVAQLLQEQIEQETCYIDSQIIFS